jgi:hypothetical protein
LLLTFSKLHYNLKEKKRPVWGSVGGFYKRFAAPAALPLPDFCTFVGQVELFRVGRLINAPGSYNLKGRAIKANNGGVDAQRPK